MRRCYRGVMLVLGGILFTGSTLLNSCSLTTLDVYAADAAHSENAELVDSQLQAMGIRTEDENVETEVPQDKFISLENNDYNVLLKIVEAEAGSEDLAGKMLVANVVLNRVNSPSFPDSVTDVVYQTHKGRAQFSPTENGTIDTVTVSQETIYAVNRVMNGDDNSMGALYFRSVHSRGTWHDRALQRVLEHGNHIFYIGYRQKSV